MTRLRWILVVLLLGLLLSATALLTSERVFRFAAEWAIDRVPGLEAGGIRGRLLSGVQLDSLRWQQADGLVLEIRQLSADWRALPALSGRLRIPALAIDSVDVHLPGAPVDAGPAGIEWPDELALPLDLRIGAFTVQRVEVWRGDESLARIDRLEGDQLVVSQHAVSIVRLRGHGTPFAFDFEAMVETRGDWPLELAGTWELALDAYPEITGETRLAGTLQSLEISQQLQSADGSAALQGTLRDLRTAPAFTGAVRIREYRHETGTLNARLDLDGWLEDLSASGTLHFRHTEFPVARIWLRADWRHAAVTVHEFDATLEDTPLELTGNAHYDWSGARPDGRAEIAWRRLELDGFTSEQGSVSVHGHPAQWQGVLEAALAGDGLPPVHARVRFSGTETQASLVPWMLETASGPVRGEARVDWSGDLHVAASASAQDFNPGELFAGWPGAVDFDLEADATVDDSGALAWQLHEFNASGELRGQALAARAAMQGAGSIPGHIDLHVDAGANSLRLQGSLQPQATLEWELDAPAVQALFPDLQGSLAGSGSLRGDREAPHVEFALTGDINGMQAHAVAGGIWQDGHFDGELREATFTPDKSLHWKLEAASGLRAGPDRLELTRTCWMESGGSRLCTRGSWQRATGTEVHANLEDLRLAQFEPWLPAGLEYTGMFDAQATFVQHGDDPFTTTGTVTAQPGSIRQHADDELITLLAWERAHLDGAITAGTLDAELELALADGGTLQGTLQLPLMDTGAGTAMQRPLQVRLQGDFTDFDLLPVFIPEIGGLTGRIRLDLTASGSRSDPEIRGTVDIDDGSLGIPRLGIHLTDIRLALHSSGEDMRVQAGMRSGPDSLEFNAALRVRDGKISGTGNLAGERFEAIKLPEVQLLVNPNISFEFSGRELRVDGEVMVPRARIEPRDFSTAVTPSPDQALIDQSGEHDPADDWRIHARVRLTLGDDVHFSGFGLDGRIAGGLVLTETPGLPTRASGELQVMEGRYRVWGQQLTIERGRLLYADRPLAQPGLDIRAVRRPQDVEVGVNVRGTLEEPEFTLFSTPTMPQSEAMSWLVLGRPLTQASGSEQELVERTSTGLGLAGGELLLGELTRRLGVGDVGIEHGDSPEQAALVIGHYLSPRLYIAYGIGLFDPGNTLRLRYQIDRRWTIRGETGPRASSSDLIYTIER